MTIVVSDTTPLSELAKIGQLQLLRDVFGEVIIPAEVYQEATTGTHPAVQAVQAATWIQVRAVGNAQKVVDLQIATNLDRGECAAIVLAEELNANQLLLDDLEARRVAQSRSLPVTGTIGTLLLAKEKGLIPNLKDLLDALMANGTRIGSRLYQDALRAAGE